MGSGASALAKGREETADKLAEMSPEHAKQVLEKIEKLIEEEADKEPNFKLLKIGKNDKKVVLKEFETGKEAKEMYAKAEEKELCAIMIKKDKVWKKNDEWMVNSAGKVAKCCFLLGCAYGEGWIELGPLIDEEKNNFCIFEEEEEGEEEEEEKSGDAEGEDEEEAGDEDGPKVFSVFCTRKGEPGFVVREFETAKEAKAKFEKKKEKGQMCLMTNKARQIGNKGEAWTDPGDDKAQKKRILFLFGVALGKGALKDDHLGPLLEEDGPLGILEEDFMAE